MKINKLDAHDRLNHFVKQDFSIGECCQDLINQRPFGDHPFYIFAHPRTDDDGVTKRMIWQPRLTKPKAETNSMLFKGYPGSDIVNVIWIIPPREMWAQYKYGLMLENQTVIDSIYAFENDRKTLEAREADDLDDIIINHIYSKLAHEAAAKAAKQELLEASQAS